MEFTPTLFQREVNLSDLMVIASPNFREAYRNDPDFRALVMSDWVNLFYQPRVFFSAALAIFN